MQCLPSITFPPSAIGMEQGEVLVNSEQITFDSQNWSEESNSGAK